MRRKRGIRAVDDSEIEGGHGNKKDSQNRWLNKIGVRMRTQAEFMEEDGIEVSERRRLRHEKTKQAEDKGVENVCE